MKRFTNWVLIFCAILTAALILHSCKSSIVDPKEGPSEERILFLKYGNSQTYLCSIKPDGTDLETLSIYVSGGLSREGYFDAQWSPDKNYIALTGGPSVDPELFPLWLMDGQGKLLRRLTVNGAAGHWSPDGNEILFCKKRDYFSFLIDYYIININTMEERLALQTDTLFWANPDWSRDGNYILTQENYNYYDDDGRLDTSDLEVVLLELDTGTRIQLTDTDVMDGAAQWSPDESQIVYISGRYTVGYQIKLMNIDGSGETVLVDTLASYQGLRWSPNGDKIVFTKKEYESYAHYANASDIFVLDLQSGEVKQITNFAAESIYVRSLDWK